ncbi:Hsp20/alpha crystallin family protein [Ramlibacter sp. MMS24-I3-19]|uniref:Hsp20/alpha crystallin family protein n=1 Tax=Ramlibacter sp. MMS24-I3-19 TaxID=3416606 RepID=UPI003D01CFC9
MANNELQTRTASDGQAPSAPHVVPPVDIFEDDSGITLLADLPGVSRERLGVRVDGDTLTLEGTAEVAGPSQMELVYGEAQPQVYRREFSLSRELDASRIEAQLKDGVLRLTIPKAEDARPRRIEVRVG